MRRNRGHAISRFFEDLSAGDPVALGLVAVLAVICIGVGLLFLLSWRNSPVRDKPAQGSEWPTHFLYKPDPDGAALHRHCYRPRNER